MHETDAEILDALRKNINKGGELLFKRYYKPLVMFADTFLPGSDVAEDFVQDVFYRFIKDKTFLHMTPDALATYLFRCVKHACLNYRRDRREICEADLLHYDLAEEEAITISPELIDNIRQAIKALPEQTRKIITAIIIHDKKYQETADELHISSNTVKSLLASGLKTLRGQFPDTLVLLFMLRE